MNIPFWLGRIRSLVLFQNVRMLYLISPYRLRLKRCPICGVLGAPHAGNANSPLDRCDGCGHIYARLQPKERILDLLYEDVDFWKEDKEHQGIHEVSYGPHWRGFLDARTGIMERTGVLDNSRPQRIFEIGCSEGILLKELGVLGHRAAGCEMNPETSRMGMEALGVRIRVCPFEQCDVESGAYDTVVSFHTVEHVRDVHALMAKVASMLKPEGALLIEVPTGPEDYSNANHLHFFVESSLQRLFGEYFDDVKVLPNEFVEPSGKTARSLYAVGRRPRPGRSRTDSEAAAVAASPRGDAPGS